MTNRKDSKGKRALFETPPIVIEDTEEPAASPDQVPEDAVEEPVASDTRNVASRLSESTTARIHCSVCGETTDVSKIELSVRILAISLWVPNRDFSRYMQCPVCQTRTWCNVTWFA